MSKAYDKVRVGDPELVTQLLLGISLAPSAIVLDIGCGTANNTLLFEKSTKTHVVGIDLSKGMLCKAYSKGTSIDFIQAQAEFLPFADSVFDFAFMTEVIHHLTGVETALQDIHRILQINGAICIATQSHTQIEDRMTSRFFPATVAVDKARYPRIDSIENMLSECGFTEIESYTKRFKPDHLGKQYLRTVENRGYSMLHKISDSEYRKGLEALRNAFAQGEELTYSAGYTFVWARKK